MDVKGGRIITPIELGYYLDNNLNEERCLEFIDCTEWSEGGLYDTFKDSSLRESPDPYSNELVIYHMYLKSGATAATLYGFTGETVSSETVNNIKRISLICKYKKIHQNARFKIKISVNGGTYYETLLDDILNPASEYLFTSGEIGFLLANQGKNIKILLEVTTDGLGNGCEIYYYALSFQTIT